MGTAEHPLREDGLWDAVALSLVGDSRRATSLVLISSICPGITSIADLRTGYRRAGAPGPCPGAFVALGVQVGVGVVEEGR